MKLSLGELSGKGKRIVQMEFTHSDIGCLQAFFTNSGAAQSGQGGRSKNS